MRLKLYRAATMAEAIAQVRAELGSEALILSTRRVADGVELTAALNQAEAVAHGHLLDSSYHGIPAALAARLGGPDLCAGLRAVFRFEKLPLLGGAPLLLAGPPGAGKTLTVARLATRLVLAGRHPLVITADGRRAGGAEELAAYTRLLGLTLLVAHTPPTLARAIADRAPGMPVLIDTAGINPFEKAETAQLSALATQIGALPVLVMPAGIDPHEAAEQASAFVDIGIDHLLPTRLDIARRLGSILAAAGAGLAFTEAGIGTGATDGLVQVTPEFLEARLLGLTAPAMTRHAHPAPGAQPTPAPRPPATPVFPTARSRAADLWDTPIHG